MANNDPTDLHALAQQDESAELDAEAIRARERDDIRWLMGHAAGRRIVWTQLERAGIFRTSFTGNSATFLNEGRRQIGLELLNDVMTHAPAGYAKMTDECSAGLWRRT